MYQYIQWYIPIHFINKLQNYEKSLGDLKKAIDRGSRYVS